ncbi:uncharacterized protein N7443_010874 [Penicillium atrosanguineum]|uniref:uncharacterized protein n=1 Tax=Penicillium atrosanguineum TaxID=1132637 RepID=UPI00238B2090|nr:uncharacterized protein N7443_010874 [Penicillium atrosanguineum]KAJ5141155.1 hypothetical protein N7526_002150 [Penicillium atrosanguineum]KAJ5290621.1 hypothetical protein N7443_010874 [Penicillium atrosanguineum]
MLCLGASASASALISRSAPAANEKFGLYAYGENLGGLSLFYADVKRESDSSSSWIANPNGTTKAEAGWSDELLYIPSSSSSDHQMGFTSSERSNETTSGFIFYGQWVMVELESGDISSSFYVREESEGKGVYSLLWNVTDEETAIPISLRSVEPSNA